MGHKEDKFRWKRKEGAVKEGYLYTHLLSMKISLVLRMLILTDRLR